MTDLYMRQPDILRKVERDLWVTFTGLLGASAVIDWGVPDWRVLWGAVTAAATLAVWRVLRALIAPSPLEE